MNEELIIRGLAARARMERPPAVDVTERVMARLREQGLENGTADTPFTWFAAMSAAAAILMVCFATSAWETCTDPLTNAVIDLTRGML